MRYTVRVRLAALVALLFVGAATIMLLVVNLLIQQQLKAAKEDAKAPVAKTFVANGPQPDYKLKEKDHKVSDATLTALKNATAEKAVSNVSSEVVSYQWTMMIVATGVVTVVGGVASWWLAGRMLRPLHQITATAQRLSLANLDQRIGLKGPRDELKELADTFDAMLDRLERAVDAQRRFVANASHELRTPLAVQRAAIEIGLTGDPSPERVGLMRKELLNANLRTEQLINGLLMLAQGQRGLHENVPVGLDGLVKEVAGQQREAAEDAGVVLTVQAEPLTVLGDSVLLSRLAANLVENAIRYNHPGGQVTVVTSADGLTVTNTGPPVPADRVPDLFEPFQRLQSQHTGRPDGAGLGLSIVAAIAAAHDTDVTAHPNPDGGLTVHVTLQPAADT